MSGSDLTEALKDQVADANDRKQSLFISGGSSKSFYGYGPAENAEPIEMSAHSGIIEYEPVELMIRVRSGTRLSEVEETLRGEGQMLAFEPPAYSGQSTIGGVVASGLSGAARPYRGSLKDYVLGITMLSGDGRHLEFGGQVMKNVAGYDVSRLMAGSMGMLGVILDISFKVLPLPESELTLSLELDKKAALAKMTELFRLPFPVTATLYQSGKLSIRLSGSQVTLSAALKKIGGEKVKQADSLENQIWHQTNVQDLPLIRDSTNLWRVSTVPGCDTLLEEACIIEWGGGIRWLANPSFNPRDRFEEAHSTNHQATLFKHDGDPVRDIFHPLQPAVMSIHQNLKKSFDPNNILNKGQMYPGL